MYRNSMAILLISICFSFASGPLKLQGQNYQFEFQYGPIDNPLRGLVPYWQQDGPFPCSMEFWYFPINELMTGLHEFNWQPIEKKLENMRSRGHQAVIRTYLEYPGRESAMPNFLVKQGVNITTYKTDSGINHTPDYHDPRLIAAMESFVTAFGDQFDGDPRVGFITMGVIGHWGEWHTYPRSKLFASKANQRKIQDAFVAAFPTTKILMRYPAGNDDFSYTENSSYPFGYHDDSFAFATLDTGHEEDDWYFEPKINAAGAPAVDKWKTQPIGGEIRPEIWGCVFDQPSCAPEGQEFETSVQRLHVSWLMDSGMFSQPFTQARANEATKQIRKMGYELFVSKATINNGESSTTVKLNIENRGVAPFYYDWPVELVALDENYKELHSTTTNWKLPEIMPGDPPLNWQGVLNGDTQNIAHVGVRISNPMENGKPLRFANADLTEDGMLILDNSRSKKAK